MVRARPCLQTFWDLTVVGGKKKTIFYAAGLSEIGTVGAAKFLSTEWRRLYKKYKKSPFLVMLRFEPTNIRNWIIEFEREN